MIKRNSRLRQQCSKLTIIVVGVLGLAPRHTEINAGTGMCVHIPFRLNPIASLAWLGKQLPCPLLEEGEKKRKRRGFTSIQMLHTHPAGTGKTLKGKRKTKADTNDGPRPKQRRGGGEQTDLQNQPTRRDGPNQHRAHT